MEEYSIEVENLRKEYTGFSLNNINFKVQKGTIMGFIGENGAGKTTAIKSIIGAVHKDGGTIKVFGEEHDEDDCLYKEDIGVVFDTCYFHDILKAGDIDKIFSRLYNNWDSDKFKSLITSMKLPKDKKIKEYSSGMKMKLSIAAALSHNPKLLLLDEATSGLDPVVRNEILDIMLDFIQNEDNSILFSSHITTDIEKVCDYITFIKNGSIVFSDDKNTIHEEYGIVRCSSEQYSRIPQQTICGTRKNRFAYDVLINNRTDFMALNRDMTVDVASFDDIMLFYSR